MAKSLLAIDIGNTSAKIGYYQSGRLLDFKSINFNTVPKYANKLMKNGNNKSLDILICSVNPNITKLLKNKILSQKGTNLWILGSNLKVDIKHKYSNYNHLGNDRKANAYGASRMYRLPLLVLAYGTALTCDYIDSRGVFHGGMIIPGPDTSLQALGVKAALLPKIHFPAKRGRFLGRNTKECMKSGILEGYGSLTDELVKRFKTRYGSELRVLATGGLAKTIAPYCSSFDILDPMHTIKSLMVLWRDKVRG